MKKEKIKVSKKAETELKEICNNLRKWAEKYEVWYVSVVNFLKYDTADATYTINDDSRAYQDVYGD